MARKPVSFSPHNFKQNLSQFHLVEFTSLIVAVFEFCEISQINLTTFLAVCCSIYGRNMFFLCVVSELLYRFEDFSSVSRFFSDGIG